MDNLIYKKVDAEELTLAEYYEAVDYLLKNGEDLSNSLEKLDKNDIKLIFKMFEFLVLFE